MSMLSRMLTVAALVVAAAVPSIAHGAPAQADTGSLCVNAMGLYQLCVTP